MFLKRALGFFALCVGFGLAVSFYALSIAFVDPLTFAIRLFALNGYIALSIAVIMSVFLKDITLFFRKSFTNVHHYFAAAGLLLITLHPIFVTIQALTPTVLLPNFSSLYLFFYNGGVVAFVLVYIGFGAALLRKKMMHYWRYLHALMYVALFIGVVHANLRGIDFQNIYIRIIYDGLFVAVLAAFVLKRWQFYRIRARARKLNASKKNQTKKWCFEALNLVLPEKKGNKAFWCKCILIGCTLSFANVI